MAVAALQVVQEVAVVPPAQEVAIAVLEAATATVGATAMEVATAIVLQAEATLTPPQLPAQAIHLADRTHQYLSLHIIAQPTITTVIPMAA